MFSASSHSGDREKPLLLAYHGAAQHVRGVRAFWPYWNFLAMTNLVEECYRRGWNLWAPQAPGRFWLPRQADHAPDMLSRARLATGVSRESPVIVCGFSQGATFAHLIVERLGRVSSGLLAYSATWKHPGGQMRANCPVAIAYNPGDPVRPVSTIERAEQAVLKFRESGRRSQLFVSDLLRHSWCGVTASRAFDWLTEGEE